MFLRLFEKRNYFWTCFFVFTSVFSFAQTPTLTNGAPAEAFPGDQVIIPLTLSNTGGTGFGPYIRLILPPNMTFDSADFIGIGMTANTIGTFPAAPGNQLTDPIANVPVTGPDGYTYINIIYPVGSVVTGGPDLVASVTATIDTASNPGETLPISAQPVYQFGDTATGDNGAIEGTAEIANTLLVLWRAMKTSNVVEGERAPGPLFTYEYTLTVDIAPTKTVSNIDINDVLPAELQYAGGLMITGGVNAQSTEPSLVTPGGTLNVTFDSATGTNSDTDIEITYSAYIIDTLDETNCATLDLINDATFDGEFPVSTPQPQLTADHTVTAKHLPIQKGVSGAENPGDTATFTLNFQVSEFATADDLVIVDTLPDGYTFDAHGSANVGGAIAITPNVNGPDVNGVSIITYDVHAVTGDLAPGTTGSITYTATVDQIYDTDGEQILGGDALTNNVLANYTLTAGATGCSDGSSATTTIRPVLAEKVIVNPQVEYLPGEFVTFRLTLEVPSGDTDGIILEDFFPLPVFDVASLDLNTNIAANTSFSFGPQDSLGLDPTNITIDAGENSLRFEFPEINTGTIDDDFIQIDIDIVVNDDPFADDLFLTNIAQFSTTNSDPLTSSSLKPVSFRVRAPSLLTSVKGVASTSGDGSVNPAPGSPNDSDLDDADAGDTVTYVITLINDGGAPAFNVLATDDAPAGLTGCSVDSVLLNGVTPVTTSGDLFGAGLELDGSIPAGDEVLITYTCTIDTSVAPRGTITNTAGVTWTSQPGAVPFPVREDEAEVTIDSPTISKTVASITPGAAGGGDVTSGDTIVYDITVTLPEGTTDGLELEDSLPAGFEYISTSVDTTGFGGSVDTSPGEVTGGSIDAGQTLTLSFAGSTTVTNDNNNANDSFVVSITARVNGTSSSNDGLPAVQNKNNIARLDWTDNPAGTVNDNVSLDFAEPDLAVTLNMAPDSNIDAGATITLTVEVTNNGTAPAYDIVVTDDLSSAGSFFDLATGATQGTIPAGYSFNYSNPTVTISADPATALAPGASVTFTYTAVVRADVLSGSAFTNDLGVTGDSQDGSVTEERSTSDTADDTVNTATVVAGKSLLASSEPWTSDTAPIVAAVGEVLTFQLAYDIPEGVTSEDGVTPIIVDTLPAGFEFLTGTALVRSAVDTTMSGSVYGNIPTSDTAVAPNVNGQDLEFDLGDITNNDNDAGTEQLILSYDVIVLNTTANNRTDSKTNTASFTYENAAMNPQAINDSLTLSIGEPNINILKTASPTTVTGGTEVTYTVLIANNFATDVVRAWELTFSDVLPTELQSPMLTSAILSRGSTDISAGVNIMGQTVSMDLSALAAAEQYLGPNESITLIYTATVDPSIGFEESVTNTGDVAVTSLPGTNGTGSATPGAPDSDTGERTGSGNNNSSGQAVNDLNNSSSDTITASQPTIDKSVADNTLQIGEITDTTITIDIPVGTTENFVVTDNLPAGLNYTGTAITITPPAMNFTASNSPSTTPGAGTDPLVFDFGDITNSAATAQQITIVYEVQPNNILSNQNTTNLTNTATLTYTGVSTPPSDDATITVLEPNLTITNTITAGATGSDAGDTISYQVVVTNTNASATAFRVNLETIMPQQLLGANMEMGPFFTNIALTNPGDAVVLNADGVTPLMLGDASQITTTNTGDTLTWPLFDLPPSTTMTITFDAVLTDTAPAGGMFDTDTLADYHSLSDGAVAGRDGSTAMSDDDNDVDLNNYNESDSVTLTLDANVAIQKTLDASQADSNYAIGEEPIFEIRVDIVEGVLDNVVVTDVLPTGIEFIELVGSIEADPNISFDGPGTAVEAPAGTITIDLGDITNTPDGDGSNDFLLIDVRGRITDIPGNVDGTDRTNSASLTTDVGNAGPDTQDVTVVEPNLTISKVPNDTTPSLGDTVTYTVTVSHDSSTADAFDVVLTDIIPAGLTYVPGSTMGQAAVDETDPSAPEFDLGTITLVEMSKSFSFRCRVDLDATVGAGIMNTINGVYSSRPGTPAVDRTYNNSGNATVTPSTPTVIDALKTVAISVDNGTADVVDPGDTLTYTITLTNGTGTAENVIFTDPIPSNTTYVAASLSSSVGTPDDSGDPLSVDIGTMNPSDSVTITFAVTVDGGTPAGTIIRNQGSVDSDQTVPEPTDEDGVDSNGDQPTDIPVGGSVARVNALYVPKIVEWIDDADMSGDISPGDTMRYVLFFVNEGNADLNNITFSDTIPAGLTAVGASEQISAPGGSIDVMGNAVTASFPLLAEGEFETAVFDVTIDGPLIDNNLDANTEQFVNQGTGDSDETEPILSDSNLDPDDGNQPTTFIATDNGSGTPVIDVEKRWSLAIDSNGDGLVNPNETVAYTIVIQNTGAATATDVNFSDTIPANMTVVPGSVSTSLGVVVTESPVLVNIGDLNPGGLLLVSFRTTVDGGTADGTIIPNQGFVTADGGINEPSDDNGTDVDGKNPTLTPVDTGGGSNAGTPTGLSKALNATSESDSASSNVFIGEVVTFRMSFNVPAGTTDEVTLIDTLPVGMSYIPNTARLARSFDTGLVASQNPGSINGQGTGTFVNLTDGTDVAISGQMVSLFMGAIINSDNDVNAETYTFELQAVVGNVAGNQAGTLLTNSASLSYLNNLGQLASLTPDTAQVTVIEPNMQVGLVANPTLMLTLGGSIQYTLTLTNPGGANVGNAYDLNISDILPAAFDSLMVDSITPTGGVSGVTDNSAGTTLDIDVSDFPVDGQLVVVFTATASGPLATGDIDNTGTVTFTSLPGAQGTGSATPGNAGDADGERTGSGVSTNDYSINDTATVTVGELNITKSITNPASRFAIGDVVSYEVVIGVPANQAVPSVVVSDVLDEGLTYVTGSLMQDFDTNLSAGMSPADFSRTDDDPAAGQETLALNYGTLTNATASALSLTLTYDALVDNILSNQDGQSLDNTVTIDFNNPAGGAAESLSDSQTLTLGEPTLTVTHTISSATTNLDAGDTVSFQVVVGNTGTTTAFETVLSNILPAGLENVTNLMVVSAAGGAESPSFTNNGSDWNTTGFDVPVGGTVTITFQADLDGTVIPGQTIQNSVAATYTSVDAVDGNERDGSTANSDQSDDSDLNNYNTDDASQTITVADPVQIDKSFHPTPSNTTYTIGETFDYRLTISILEGTVDDLVVTDTLPDDVRFESAAVGNGNIGITSGYGGSPGQAGQVLTFDLMDVSNPANGNTMDDFITIDVTVTVLDEVANVDGAIISNNADVSFTGPSGNVMRDFDDDSGTPGIQGLDASLVEPNVTISKTAADTMIPQDDEVTFTVLLDHIAASNSDAYDLQVVDTLPAGLSYVAGSASLAPTSVAGQVITWDIAALTLAADNTSFTYRAEVDPGATLGDMFTNAADLTYTSQPGANADERSYNDSDSETVTVAAETFIDALKTVGIAVDGGTAGQVDVGDTLEYSITLENNGSTAFNTVFIDPIPVNTTYVMGSLTSSVGGEDDSNPSELVVNVGDMLDAATVIITFRVTVDAGTPTGTIIRNQGSVDSDDTTPEPTDVDGMDSNGDQPTDIPVGGFPTLAQPLYVPQTVTWQIDADASNDITPNDTLFYTYLITNRGDQPLTNVTLSDSIPMGLTHNGTSGITNSGVNTLNVVGSSINATVPTLAPGETVQVTVGFTVNDPLFDTDAMPTIETFITQAIADSNETDSTLSDGNSDPLDGLQPTQFTAVDGVMGTPALDVEKRWNLANDLDGDGLVDPSDAIGYSIRLSNVGSAIAQNVQLDDPIPGDTSIVMGTATSSRGTIVTEDPLAVNIGDVDPGEVVTLSFLVTVNPGTPDGTIIPNQATASGDNFADEPSDDNGTDTDGKNPTLTPVDNSGGGGAGAPGSLTLSLVDTTEADTMGANTAIGEIATFDLQVAIPAGVINEGYLTVTLPAGLTYMPGTSGLARSFETGLVASEDPGGVNSAATDMFVMLADGTEVAINGQTLTVFLGNLINSDDDANDETYTLRFDALVDNEAGNQDSISQTVSGTFGYLDSFNQPAELTPDTAAVTIVEPDLALTLSPAPSAILPVGGDVQFTLTVTNNGTSDAYDVNILDNLPAEYTSFVVDNIQLNGGAAGATDNSAGTDLDVLVDQIPVGGSVVITYTATAPGPIAVNSVQSTGSATYTSLPGAQGTGDVTPGNSGDADGERNGNNMGPNDYRVADTATVIIGELGIAKAVNSGAARYAIGQTVDYEVTVSVPGTGSVTNVTIDDVLPEGLTYETGSLVINFTPGVSASNVPGDFSRTDNDPAAGQETLALNLGTLTNNNNLAAGFTLNYSAVVDNLLGNQDNQILSNTVTLAYDDPGGGPRASASDNASVTVGEPDVTLTKTATSAVVGLEAGDTVDFRIVVGNNGTTTAFETTLTDVLPTGMENAANLSVSAVSGGAETPTFNNNGGDWSTSAFDLPVGGSVTITFTATLSNTVLPDQQIQNTVLASYTSLDGMVAGERDGSDLDSNQDDDSDLNNYNTDATSQIIQVANTVSIDKRFYPSDTITEYTIGATVGYRLTISLQEGTTANATVEDVLPDGLTFVDSNVGLGNLGMTISGSDVAVVNDQTISFELGDILNPANGSSADDFITVDLTATVNNDAMLQNGTILGNNAAITFDGAGGTATVDFDAEPGTPGIQPLDLAVVLPDLSLNKVASDTQPRPGDVLLFTVTLSHSLASDADAFDIEITDNIPVGLTYVLGSASPSAVVNGRQLIWDLAALTQKDGSAIFTYQARVDNPVPLGAALTNTVTATYSTLPGDEAGERTGEDGVGGLNDLITETTEDVTPVAPALDASKSAMLLDDVDGDGLVSPGDGLRYTVELVNSGNAAASDVVFSDGLEANLTLVSGSVTTTQGTVNTGNSGGDNQILVTIGSVAQAATVTLTYDARVVNPLPLGVDRVVNQGLFQGSDVPDVPTDDPDTPEGDDPTEVPVFAAPDFVVTKVDTLSGDSNSNGVANPGEVISYSIDITNVGNQAAAFSLLNDVLDPYVELVPGSVTTSFGSVVSGNNLNDTFVQVDLDTIIGGATVNVGFDVRVRNPLPTGVNRVANQAVVSADGVPAVLSDDPDVPGDDDPTVTPVGAEPILVHSKSDSLLVDDDGNSIPSPGDTLRYTLTLTNIGNTDALNVSLSDLPDSNTTLVAGSVTTSQGTVVSGMVAPVEVLIGDVAASDSVMVTFDVTINTPLDASITRVRNQAIASGDNLPDTPSDDPDVPGDEDPTDTPITAKPVLQVTKTDALYIDVNGDGFANPGDTLVYSVDIRNVGNAPATGVVFSDIPDSNTTLLPNSVTTSRGTVIAGQTSNPPIVVELGDLNPGISASISFFVTVNDPLPEGVTRVANQGVVSANELPDTPSDDPDVPGEEDPTETPVGGEPQLRLTKSDALFEDADDNGLVSPGDVLSYIMVLTNEGNATATNIDIVDYPDVNTELIAGTVTASLGSVLAGNDGNAPIRIQIGDLAGNGAQATMSFRVRVVDPLPAGVTRVTNQAIATSDNTPDEPSDDPDVPGDDDPTETPVDTFPQLTATKTDSLAQDNDGDSEVSAGDTLLYRVVIRNTGNTTATDVIFRDTPGENLSLVNGSVQTSRGTVTGGNAGLPPIVVELGSIAVDEQAVITFHVDIADPLPFGVTQVENQGVVVASDVPSVPTDDPETPNVDDPTVTPVSADSRMVASKDATLFEDVDGNGIASPGDVLLYTVDLRNVGNAEATNVVYSDTPDSNTSLIAGSVQTSAGNVVSGNDGNPPIVVNVGTVAAGGGNVQISYRVTIADPLPVGVNVVVNQGFVDSDTEDDVPTDDPDLPGDDDPTEEPVTAEPSLRASKTDLLFDDANGDGEVSPNDALLYVIEIRNDGNGTATDVTFNDSIDPLTTIEAGTVQTTRGTVNNETPISITIGDMLPGEVVNVSFRVRISTPFPADVEVVVNQGTVGSNELPDVLTDDPDEPGDDDPTETPVTGFGEIEATKADALFDDADMSGGPSAGDTLEYTIAITNTGTRDAPGVDLVDFPDTNTTLIVGSVTTTQGSVTVGNGGGDSSIAVALGDIPGGGGMAQVTFRVTINDPLPAGVTLVRNQGVLTPDEGPAVLTDDPDVDGDDDPTDTPLEGTPSVVASKTATLEVDNNGNGIANAGDTLRYQVVIRNQGSATATNLIFNDTPDSNTSLVNGSVTTTQGAINGGNAGLPPVLVALGSLNPGTTATVTFDVTINDPLPAGVAVVVNQGVVSGDDLPDVPTDDPDVDGPEDPTVTPVGEDPKIVASKTDSLLVDLDNNGFAGPGETLLYLVRIRNQGNGEATGVTFVDYPDANTSLVVGTVATTQGSVTAGNDGSAPIRVNVGNLAAGDAVEISFQVTIADPLASNVTFVANQGIVRGGNVPDTPTDDPEDPGDEDPTITDVDTEPRLVATKRDILAVDNDGDGVFSSGDELLYQVVIYNAGNGEATNVNFTDRPDENTTLVAGSVITNNGVVVAGNAGTPPIEVNIGNIAAKATVEIAFRVTINDPLPLGLPFVRNQGVISSDELPDVLTDDPDIPGDDQPTDTPLGNAPVILASKTDYLTNDADGSGDASADDTLTYVVEIYNTGNATATNVVFRDFPDENTSLIPGRVRTDRGTIVGGQDGTVPVQVEIGPLAPGDVATVSFDVRIVNPLPLGLELLVNQGLVTSDNYPGVLTDDPDEEGLQDPTVTPLGDRPLLRAKKTAVFVEDNDDNGFVNGGDVIAYTISIVNDGRGTALNVAYNDTPDVNTGIIPGSVQTSLGSVVGGQAGTPPITVNLGDMPFGQRAEISYRVTVVDPLDPMVESLINNGLVTSDNHPDVPTDDPVTTGDDDTVVTPDDSPNLVSTKTDSLFTDRNGDGVSSPGDTVLYQIVVQNTGSVAAEAVIFTDTPDPVTSIVPGSVQTSQGVVLEGQNGVPPISIAVGEIPPNGGIAFISFLVEIDIPLPISIAQIVNQGEFTAENLDDPVMTDDPDSADVSDATPTLVFQADLQVTKTASVADVNAGDTFNYDIVVENLGPNNASQVRLVDPLPVGLTYLSSSTADGTCSYDPVTRTMTCDLGVILVGNQKQVTLNVRSNVEGLVENVAEVSAIQIDPNPDNNFDDAPINSGPGVDLSLVKTVDDPVTTINDVVVYTITLSNAGPSTATNVVVTDNLPAGLTFVAANPSSGSYNEGSGLWTIPTMAAGAVFTLELQAQVTADGSYVNVAEVTAHDQPDIDSTPNNGDINEDDMDQVTVMVDTVNGPSIDLSLTKTIDNLAPEFGDTVIYTLTLANDGPLTANNIEVTDTLPSNFAFVSATPSSGTFDDGSGVWSLASLANGAVATLAIEGTITAIGELRNVAEVTDVDEIDVDSTPNNGDPTEDDQDEVTVLVDTLVNLVLLKDVNDTHAHINETLIWTLTLRNDGPSPATGVTVTDMLPEGLRFVESAATRGSYDAVTGVWTVGDLGVNETVVLEINTVLTDAATPAEPIFNFAVATSDQPDGDPSDNEDDAQVYVNIPVPVLGPFGMLVFIALMMSVAIYQRRQRTAR